ncbi:putative choline kinase 1 [Hibiscus syriacus]|uniref:non-specific serine/threonine protein kinase n=1 Tax=Hibiscus syriacus TaxID=106335 RepID=A0A6A2YT56_HIBSY|nr:putative choline kinase 1 [Hibiscus syriacus]
MAIKKNGFIPSSAPEELKRVFEEVATGWGDAIQDIEEFDVIPLKGAMTNEVFQINWPTNHGDLHHKVLVRIYGEGVEVFFDRDDEIRTFECMSKHGQGPRLLGRFSDGRIEEFIHARTLSASDLRDPEISSLIAAKLREFHDLDMPGLKNVFLWERLRTWLSQAKKICSRRTAEEFGLHVLGEEISILEKELTRSYQEIGFCHNDLQYGNIMMDEETRAITLIDYEYASYNPIAYDLANHFCEMAANYHSETPHILDYRIYPGSIRTIPVSFAIEQQIWRSAEDSPPRIWHLRGLISLGCMHAGNEHSDAEVGQLLANVEKYTLANHMFWGFWGIISGHANKRVQLLGVCAAEDSTILDGRKNLIGKGCSGVVYRAEMPNGELIVVKKLWKTKQDEEPAVDSFAAEIQILGHIRHRNIVKLLGYCSNKSVKLLLYNYIPNGNLLQLSQSNRNLDWETRYKIAVGSAQGLAYLHHDCRPAILHRDVKCNNILLDSKFEAYLADFGLAKLMNSPNYHHAMSRVAGSYGYIAPGKFPN